MVFAEVWSRIATPRIRTIRGGAELPPSSKSERASRFEVAVLGGGAAGLMAAIQAAEAGAKTLLIEKNRRPGVKILASGGGRCNLTTTRTGDDLLSAFPQHQRRWLAAPLRAWTPKRLRAWFEEHGVRLLEEGMEKVFPAAGKASVILDALVEAADSAKVVSSCGNPVRSVRKENEADPFRIITEQGEFFADVVILATGGKSYPKTGTTGDGYQIAQQLGHSITKLWPALVGLKTKGSQHHELAGLTLPEAAVHLHRTGKRVMSWARPVLFTHQGLSGPGPMNLSGPLTSEGGSLLIDLVPKLSFEELDAWFISSAQSQPHRAMSRLLQAHVPDRLGRFILRRCGVEASELAQELRRRERRAIVHALKGLAFEVSGTRGFDHAEVTQGGVPLKEVDRRSMASKRCPGLYLCGEILDIDGPIGGYNFQAAFATGWVAGTAGAKAVRAQG